MICTLETQNNSAKLYNLFKALSLKSNTIDLFSSI